MLDQGLLVRETRSGQSRVERSEVEELAEIPELKCLTFNSQY